MHYGKPFHDNPVQPERDSCRTAKHRTDILGRAVTGDPWQQLPKKGNLQEKRAKGSRIGFWITKACGTASTVSAFYYDAASRSSLGSHGETQGGVQ
jgi:hypothetical protein